MARSTSPRPPISLMDIFIGSGRTIRKPTGLPGTDLPRRTELVQVRPSASTSARKSSGDSKPAVAVESSSNKENATSGSKSNSKKEVAPAPSDSKSNSKKDDSKPSSTKEDIKPSSSKDDSKPSSSKSDSKPNSNKVDSKPNSKPTSAKAPSDGKAADDKKADTKKSEGKKPEEPMASGSKPQANAQQSSDLVFTPEEDAKILLMKTEGIDAKVIAAELGKGKKQINKRFDLIKPKDWIPPPKGRKDVAAVVEMKKDKPSEKQLSKVDKKEDKAVESRNKFGPVEKMKKHEDAPTAILLAGKVQHDVRLRHAHHHDHHVHLHDSHDSRPRHHTHNHPSRHRTTAVLDPTDSGYGSNHRAERAHKHHRSRPAASIAASSAKTAFTIKTMPCLSEDDLFSFGELQALSELIGKDMEGMWHRVSAAFFGMTGRRIPAEEIKEKFAGLEVE